MHSNGLRVRNLKVHDSLDMHDDFARNQFEREHVMGYWQKALIGSQTHIHLSRKLDSPSALLYVLSHELAHEYHYQCLNPWTFLLQLFQMKFVQPTYEGTIEGYVDSLGMFLLARTCVHDPAVTLEGFVLINGGGQSTTQYRRLAVDVARARAFAARACSQPASKRDKYARFDAALCPWGGVLNYTHTL